MESEQTTLTESLEKRETVEVNSGDESAKETIKKSNENTSEDISPNELYNRGKVREKAKEEWISAEIVEAKKIEKEFIDNRIEGIKSEKNIVVYKFGELYGKNRNEIIEMLKNDNVSNKLYKTTSFGPMIISDEEIVLKLKSIEGVEIKLLEGLNTKYTINKGLKDFGKKKWSNNIKLLKNKNIFIKNEGENWRIANKNRENKSNYTKRFELIYEKFLPHIIIFVPSILLISSAYWLPKMEFPLALTLSLVSYVLMFLMVFDIVIKKTSRFNWTRMEELKTDVEFPKEEEKVEKSNKVANVELNIQNDGTAVLEPEKYHEKWTINPRENGVPGEKYMKLYEEFHEEIEEGIPLTLFIREYNGEKQDDIDENMIVGDNENYLLEIPEV